MQNFRKTLVIALLAGMTIVAGQVMAGNGHGDGTGERTRYRRLPDINYF